MIETLQLGQTRGCPEALCAQELNMEGIVAMAFLVRCGSKLLMCQDLPAQPDRFADMAACRAAMPALIRHHQAQESGPPVVMGKCRLMVAPQNVPPEDASELAGMLW